MKVFAASLLSILGFVLAFIYLSIAPISKKAIDRARLGMMAMLDNTMPEEDKEAAVQAAGLALLKSSFEIFWRILACLAAAAAPILMLDYMDAVPFEMVINLMIRWDYILGTTLILGGIAWFFGHSRKPQATKSAYSVTDQVFHNLAFSGPGIQFTAADIEDRLFGKKIGKIQDQPPIFITSLPRAGTTVLLTALNELPQTATHLYRDMPFVMAPMLWSRVSGMFQKRSELKERAHGDGIKIGYDSAEAFEEVLWHAFWPNKYHDDHIDLWDANDVNQDATAFFFNHFRKIVALRTNGVGRYISKNNNNIARLDLIPEMFPGAQTVVPLREPSEHATSLLRQHKNFLQQHAQDPFVKRYMRDIGHLEFGELHTPFAFDGLDRTSTTNPELADYWLDYWIAAHETVLKRIDYLYVVSHEKLGKQPEAVMNELCDRLHLDHEGIDLAKHFRLIRKKAEDSLFNASKLSRAREIYREMLRFEI